MLNIAICDDNIEELSKLNSIIDYYIKANGNELVINCKKFKNSLELIASLEKNPQYDLIILDIIMPLFTGMDTAKEIRLFDKNVKIIFLSSSPEFALESYSVNAYYYFLKPISKENLFKILDKIILEIKHQLGSSFLVKSSIGLLRVYIDKLEFAEIKGRTMSYNFIDGSTIESNGSMIELEKILSGNSNFIKPHRSYIINMKYISTISKKEITMRSNSHVPMAKINYNSIKSAYINYSFED